jgi:hypothetical protein
MNSRFLRRLPFLLAAFWFFQTSSRAGTPCPFDTNKLEFVGTPVEQARCLLRPVFEYGRLGKPLDKLPAPLEDLIGRPVAISRADLQAYLTAHKIDDSAVAGPVTNFLRAKYFVIHDTSTPNYHDKPIPTDINDPAWRFNDLALASKGKVAHFFVNRVGESIAAHPITVPWRATKFERTPPETTEMKHGLFIHTELIQPRRSDPAGHSGNDGIAAKPGFTEAQLDRLALLYIVASVQHGQWMVPAFHATLDTGIPDGHDDPQNFDLTLWANRLSVLLASFPSTAPSPK